MRKKSMELAAKKFDEQVARILEFTKRVKEVRKLRKSVKNGMTQEDSSRFYLTKDDENVCFDIAIISLYREFENFILGCLIAFINNNPSTFAEHKGRRFPKNIGVEACEYLICGDGYFDFRGYDGLIKEIKKFVPSNHWFLAIVKKDDYKDALNKLSSLRNFAAHNSSVSKKKALKCTKQQRMLSSGAWLKIKIQDQGYLDENRFTAIQKPDQKQGETRFTKICESLRKMAEEIGEKAPH